MIVPNLNICAWLNTQVIANDGLADELIYRCWECGVVGHCAGSEIQEPPVSVRPILRSPRELVLIELDSPDTVHICWRFLGVSIPEIDHYSEI